MKVSAPSRQIRFGLFEVDLHTGELRKQGLRLTLKGQPFDVLAMLLARPGEMVTREELQKKLWPADTFVDFEHGLNTAVKKLREALGDSAENPRFVETLARRGYRFIYPVEGSATSQRAPSLVGKILALQTLAGKRWFFALTAASMVALVSLLFALNIAGLGDRLLRHTVPVPRIESIAVLPLENLSGDPEQEYFAEGMTDALIAELGQIGSLRVISRTSALRYKKTDKPLPQIARELNVDAVIEGSVFRAGDRVRITAELIRAVPERHLWARNYERNLRDVLTLQGEIARAVADEVKANVTPDVRARLATARPVNPEAHQAYLRGRYFLNRLTKQDLQKAIEYAQQAVEIDPHYAAAYGLLATSYWQSSLFEFGDLPNREAIQKARTAATRALEIDEALAEGHYAMGTVRFYGDWDWAGAEREYKRAIELDPGFVDADAKYALYLATIGRHDESLREAARILQLDPVSFGANHTMTMMYYFARQYDQAIEQAQKWIEIYPSSASAYYWLFQAYWGKGAYDNAIAAWQKDMILREEPEDPAAMGRAYKNEGMTGYWRLRVARERRRGDVWCLAFTYAQLGEKDRAFELLEKMYRERDPGTTLLRVEPFLDPLRSDPRFQDLLRRMNFPP
jgi:TolB-like protein/DNA-binding winged helix-turn-helix (wHTH) protein/Tfp pilus assembly protein PilF